MTDEGARSVKPPQKRTENTPLPFGPSVAKLSHHNRGDVTMQGKILGFDPGSGEGMISGEDGRRYAFGPTEWRHRSAPQSGQRVDFDAQDGRAAGIYVTGGGAMAADKNRFVAALLAFFLGTLGLHKFYLGRIKAGIIMLCVAVFGSILFGVPTAIIAIIALIECIIYLVTPDEAFERKYVEGDTAWF